MTPSRKTPNRSDRVVHPLRTSPPRENPDRHGNPRATDPATRPHSHSPVAHRSRILRPEQRVRRPGSLSEPRRARRCRQDRRGQPCLHRHERPGPGPRHLRGTSSLGDRGVRSGGSRPHEHVPDGEANAGRGGERPDGAGARRRRRQGRAGNRGAHGSRRCEPGPGSTRRRRFHRARLSDTRVTRHGRSVRRSGARVRHSDRGYGAGHRAHARRLRNHRSLDRPRLRRAGGGRHRQRDLVVAVSHRLGAGGPAVRGRTLVAPWAGSRVLGTAYLRRVRAGGEAGRRGGTHRAAPRPSGRVELAGAAAGTRSPPPARSTDGMDRGALSERARLRLGGQGRRGPDRR